MTYKTILVCLDEVNRIAALAAASARIAGLTEAHVRGLYVIPAAQIYPSTGFEAVPQVFEGHRTYFQTNKDSVRSAFEQAMTRQGVTFDFIAVEGRSPLIADEVLNHGRSCDLILMHATDPAQVSGVELDYIERVVMAVGRPVLVLPRQGSAELKLDEVIVGWNAHREATRAVFDALPLLKAAASVRLVWVDPQTRRRHRCVSSGSIRSAKPTCKERLPAPISPSRWPGMESKPPPKACRAAGSMPVRRCCSAPPIPVPGFW